MKAILMVRVSAEIQDYDPQIEDLRKYAIGKGFKTFTIIETKESGLANLENRTGLEQLKTFLQQNNDYKDIFVTEISRLGRRNSVLYETKEYLFENQIRLHIKDRNIESLDSEGKSDPNFDLFFSIYASLAEIEIKTKKDRFNRAKIQYKKNGYYMGGKRLFGYDIKQESDKKKLYVVHPTESEIVKRIFNWYHAGINTFEPHPSIKKICMLCISEGFPPYTHSKRNVNKLLNEEAYTGFKITANKYVKTEYTLSGIKKVATLVHSEMTYPQIIDKSLFERVQEKMKSKNIKADKSNVHVTLLSKKIRCKECSNFFTADYRIIGTLSKSCYRCGSRVRVGSCKNKQSISLEMIDALIWQSIKQNKNWWFRK